MLGRARAAVWESERLHAAASMTGFAALPGAVVFALAGLWVLAVLAGAAGVLGLWMAGAWLLPSTEDAYFIRMSRYLGDGFGAVTVSYGLLHYRVGRLGARLGELAPPPRLKEAHERLLQLQSEVDAIAADTSLPYDAMLRRTIVAARRARELEDHLVEADSLEGHDYGRSLTDLREETLRSFDRETDKAEQAALRIVARIKRTKPPRRLARAHDALGTAATQYLEAMRGVHGALRNLDEEWADQADTDLEAASRNLNAAIDELWDHASFLPKRSPPTARPQE